MTDSVYPVAFFISRRSARLFLMRDKIRRASSLSFCVVLKCEQSLLMALPSRTRHNSVLFYILYENFVRIPRCVATYTDREHKQYSPIRVLQCGTGFEALRGGHKKCHVAQPRSNPSHTACSVSHTRCGSKLKRNI